MTELTFKVKKMKCEGCENRIKNVLSEIDEIKDVSANYKTGTVKIKLNNQSIRNKIIEIIEDLGFVVEDI